MGLGRRAVLDRVLWDGNGLSRIDERCPLLAVEGVVESADGRRKVNVSALSDENAISPSSPSGARVTGSIQGSSSLAFSLSLPDPSSTSADPFPVK